MPLYMDAHLERFKRSASLLRLNVDINDEKIISAVSTLMEKNNLESAGIKLIATGGESPDGFSVGKGSLAILALPYVHPSGKMVSSGIKLLSYEYQRILPHIKSINYLYAVYLSEELKKAGAMEPLYYTPESVRETARANIMAVINGRIVTPSEKILAGITRNKIVHQLDLDVEERNITIDELKNADEVFICGTTKRALGVVQIDDKVIGDGKPGKVTMMIRSRLLAMEEKIMKS